MKKREVSLLIFYNDRNEILLQDRRSHSKAGEEWGFFGGGIEAGENAVNAVKREVKEEMDIELSDINDQIGIVENTYFNSIQNCSINVRRNVFVREYKNEKLKILEGAECAWFNLAEARKLKLVPGDIGVLDLVKNYLKR